MFWMQCYKNVICKLTSAVAAAPSLHAPHPVVPSMPIECTTLSIGVRATCSPPITYSLFATHEIACDERAQGPADVE